MKRTPAGTPRFPAWQWMIFVLLLILAVAAVIVSNAAADLLPAEAPIWLLAAMFIYVPVTMVVNLLRMSAPEAAGPQTPRPDLTHGRNLTLPELGLLVSSSQPAIPLWRRRWLWAAGVTALILVIAAIMFPEWWLHTTIVVGTLAFLLVMVRRPVTGQFGRYQQVAFRQGLDVNALAEASARVERLHHDEREPQWSRDWNVGMSGGREAAVALMWDSYGPALAGREFVMKSLAGLLDGSFTPALLPEEDTKLLGWHVAPVTAGLTSWQVRNVVAVSTADGGGLTLCDVNRVSTQKSGVRLQPGSVAQVAVPSSHTLVVLPRRGGAGVNIGAFGPDIVLPGERGHGFRICGDDPEWAEDLLTVSILQQLAALPGALIQATGSHVVVATQRSWFEPEQLVSVQNLLDELTAGVARPG